MSASWVHSVNLGVRVTVFGSLVLTDGTLSLPALGTRIFLFRLIKFKLFPFSFDIRHAGRAHRVRLKSAKSLCAQNSNNSDTRSTARHHLHFGSSRSWSGSSTSYSRRTDTSGGIVFATWTDVRACVCVSVERRYDG